MLDLLQTSFMLLRISMFSSDIKINVSFKVQFVISLLSGIWFYLISPPSVISFSAWFAYVPILFISSQCSYKKSFLLGSIFGFTGNFLIFYWLIDTVSTFSDITWLYALLIVIFNALTLSLPMGLLALASNISWKKTGHNWIVIVPAILVIIEYFSAYIALFPYQHGMSQFDNLMVLQLSSVTGNWGVSFLILIVNTFMTSLFILLLSSKQKNIRHTIQLYGIPIAILLTLIMMYGSFRVEKLDLLIAKTPTISVLQLQDRVSSQDWVTKNKDRALKNTLSQYWFRQTETQTEKVDWIIWPESSVPINVEAKFHKLNLSKLAQSKNSYISLGGTARDKNAEGKTKQFNSVFNFSNQGKYLGRYDKQILVPFSEFTPFAHSLGLPNLASNFSAGQQSNTFMIDKARVAFPICYEAIFQSTYRAFSDADLMANLSNDIWFVNSRGRELHAMISQIRAIEFGVPILRVGYTGLSFYMQANGKQFFKLPPDTKQQRVISIHYGKVDTFYAKWGDWFVLFCGIMIIVRLLLSSFKSSKVN